MASSPNPVKDYNPSRCVSKSDTDDIDSLTVYPKAAIPPTKAATGAIAALNEAPSAPTEETILPNEIFLNAYS
jgi:hypothetical protein